MLKRDNYLSKIRGFYDSDLIKILVGIRRCGKSIILEQITKEIKDKGVDDEHIININFEFIEYEELQDYKKLNTYIKNYLHSVFDSIILRDIVKRLNLQDVTYELNSEEVISREFGAFNVINDNYPKYVISLDKRDFSKNGIKHLNLIDFLIKNEF